MTQIRVMELRGTYKGGGGPDKTILLSAAKHCGHDFFILVTYLRDPRDKEFQIGEMAINYGVKDYIEVFDKAMIDLRCISQLNILIRKHSIAIIHVHDLKTTLLGIILKVLNPDVKIMHTAHGWIISSLADKIKQRLQFVMLRWYPVHIAVSGATKALMVEKRIPEQTIKVLYNSIDTKYWKKGNGFSVLRQEYHIPPDVLVVGTVGRLSREKDLTTFFKVAERILAKIPDTVFFIVGDGLPGIVSELKKQLKNLDLTNNMHFTGHRTDLLNIYESFDLFLMTSLTEGLPNTVLEAMALEIPVVGTAVGGVPELVIHKKSGILCQPGDVDALACGSLELLLSSDKRNEMGKNARLRIKENFDFNTRLKRIETIYKSMN